MSVSRERRCTTGGRKKRVSSRGKATSPDSSTTPDVRCTQTKSKEFCGLLKQSQKTSEERFYASHKQEESENDLRAEVQELEARYMEKLGEVPFLELIQNFKKELLLFVLQRHHGNIQASARILQMNRPTLSNMLQGFRLYQYVQKLREEYKGKIKPGIEPKKTRGVKKPRRCRACKKVHVIYASDSCPACHAPRQYIRPLSQTERIPHDV